MEMNEGLISIHSCVVYKNKKYFFKHSTFSNVKVNEWMACNKKLVWYYKIVFFFCKIKPKYYLIIVSQTKWPDFSCSIKIVSLLPKSRELQPASQPVGSIYLNDSFSNCNWTLQLLKLNRNEICIAFLRLL